MFWNHFWTSFHNVKILLTLIWFQIPALWEKVQYVQEGRGCLKRRRIRVALSKVGGLCLMVGVLDRMVVQAGKEKRRHFITAMLQFSCWWWNLWHLVKHFQVEKTLKNDILIIYINIPCMEEVDWHFLSSTQEGLCKEVENMHHICPSVPRLLLPPDPPHIWGWRTRMKC